MPTDLPPSAGRFVVPAIVLLMLGGAALSLVAARREAPTTEGEALFQQKCALCHSAGDKNGQGPGLGGVFGRKAAARKGFPYSPALKESNLVWDKATLDKFLTAPSQLVPGTTMPVSVPDDNERRALIYYLDSIRVPPQAAMLPLDPNALPPPPATPRLRTGVEAFGDYRDDGPGVRRHITAADLPPPGATGSAVNGPRVVARPSAAHPAVPPGFSIALFADHLQNNRLMRTAPNGDLFVAESAPGRVRVLRAADGATVPDLQEVFAAGLSGPFGLAFYPPGSDPQWLYVATNNTVVRFPYKNGDLRASGPPETIVEKLSPTSGGHTTRDIQFSADGARMFVSVGSASNVAEGIGKAPAGGVAAWDAAHGLGATWADEERRADVLVFDPLGHNDHIFATGIRNCVGLAINPTTGDLWCSTNERDGLGDNLVPDYLTRVREGAYYGWPWFYIGPHQDPRLKDARLDLADKVTVPDVLLQPHSASLQMTFYDGTMFPPEYRGNAFAALHGSWNRSQRTGYKIIRAIVKEGIPTGEYEDFVTGFVIDDGYVWARPVGIAVAHDGALFIGEDGNGSIWRVTYAAPK